MRELLLKAIPYGKKLVQALIRLGRPVAVNDLLRVEPIGYSFGADRGQAIDRYYIEKFLEAHRPLITGTVLEIAESSYSRKFGLNVSRYEVLHALEGNPNATLVGDLTKPESLPAGVADCFICTQTLPYIYDVSGAVAGARRLLRSGGVLIGTVSGIAQISPYDRDRWGDYWRFTSMSLRLLLEPFFPGGVTVQSYGNVMAACAFLQCLAVEDLPERDLLDRLDPSYPCILGFVARS